MSFMEKLAQYTVFRIPSNQNILGETVSHVDERRFDRIIDRRRHFVDRTEHVAPDATFQRADKSRYFFRNFYE